MANRNYRLAGEIKRDLTDIFAHEIRDPHIDSMVSVTDVEVSNDLSYARIYVSKLGSDKEAAIANIEETFTSGPAWQTLRAVKEGRYYVLDPYLYNLKPNERWGEAYEKMADILYPENSER